MKRWTLWLTAAGLAALGFGAVALWAAARQAHAFSGVAASPPAPAPDFTLIDEAGRPFTLSELRGQWILLNYGYTACPDVCPATLTTLRRVRELLGAQAAGVQIVFVSVDPERDTPDKMAEYVGRFGAGFIGLTGSPDEVALAARLYDVKYQKKESTSAAGYLVGHSAFVYLIDPEFRLRLTYPFGVEPEEMAADLTYLFSQTEQE